MSLLASEEKKQKIISVKIEGREKNLMELLEKEIIVDTGTSTTHPSTLHPPPDLPSTRLTLHPTYPPPDLPSTLYPPLH